ncbi:MAG TPA: PAS domain S-box protein [Candidatus Deferrimicrobiaceae bacterium]|jgi:PAS domain S-box-containing protein
MSDIEEQSRPLPEIEMLKARIDALEARKTVLVRYLRDKTDDLLKIMHCSVGNADTIDDETLLSLDPIGTITDSFSQVVENLHGVNDRLWAEIDERSRIEAALRENEARLQDFFDSALDYIQIIDSEGRFITVNRAWREAMGYSEEELAGMTMFDIIAPDSLDHCRRCFERILGNSDVGRVEFALLAKGGRRIVVEGYVTARTEEGNVIAARSIFRDITERKALEQNLLNAEKLETIGVLAGGIAHDFNNLLTAILGNISLALERLPEGGDVRDRLVEAEGASLRARDLTLQLLTFSKGGAPIRRTTSIADVIRDSAGFALRGSNVRCEYALPEDLYPVDIDAGQFNQVIHNLVSNADQAMPAGGMIHIRAENVDLSRGHGLPMAPGRCVRISIEDQGVGIPADRLKHIFDPFFSTREDGSGLGLAVSYSVVKQHEGALTVESEPGRGTTFRIHLPATFDGSPRSPVVDVPSQPIPSRPRRVLIMDDEESVRKVAVEVLSTIGYETLGVADGAAAIEAYDRARQEGAAFDAVIMDLTIPGGIGGKEAVRKVLDLDPHARVIVSSGYSNDPVMADYRAFGFCGVIAKPYRIRELRELLARIISGGASRP